MNEFWRNKTVLITSARGFIGSYLVEKLHPHGAHVRAFIRYNSHSDHGLLPMLLVDIQSMHLTGDH
jgi:nucleoside-diphosphate-sugar epimerase